MTHEREPNEDEWGDLGPAEDIPAKALEGVGTGVEGLPDLNYDPEAALGQAMNREV